MMNTFKKFKINNSVYIMILIALLAGYIKHVTIIMLIIIGHELGHVFFCLLFNIDVEKIEIFPFGGITYVNKRIHERIFKDIIISMGGILFQLIFYIFVYLLYKNNIIVLSTYHLFNKYNLSIIIFNLIPIIPLDGSKLIFCIFCKFFSYKGSYIMMIITGIISLFIFIIYNYIYKLNDLILYIFLIYKLYEVIKYFKFIMNKFYLERVIYDHYYNAIINDIDDINKLRIDKFYYFKDKNRYINEKDYIKKIKYY